MGGSLRTLLFDVAELIDWYPACEQEKMGKAAVLADQLPCLLETLEDAVVDAVLVDTVAELTRLDVTRAMESCGVGISSATPAADTVVAGALDTSSRSAAEEVLSFV